MKGPRDSRSHQQAVADLRQRPFPAPFLQAFALIESSLGRPLGEVFSSISERPIAAASLGQVYKAVLRDTGEEVAVKVGWPAARAAGSFSRHHGGLAGQRSRVLGEEARFLLTSCIAAAALLLLQVQRPGVEPLIFRDIFIFRTLGTFINGWWAKLQSALHARLRML